MKNYNVLKKTRIDCDKLRELYKETISEIAIACGLDCILADNYGRVIYYSNANGKCDTGENLKLCEACRVFMESNTTGVMKAQIYTCENGHGYSYMPVYVDEYNYGFSMLGPFCDKNSKISQENANIDSLSDVKRLSAERIHAVTKVHRYVITENTRNIYYYMTEEKNINKQKAQIVMKLSTSKPDERHEYPVNLESVLYNAIVNGDRNRASNILNQLLSYILYSKNVEKDIAYVLARVVELLTVVSRAAIDSGVDAEICLEMNKQRMLELESKFHTGSFKDIDNIAIWLTEVIASYYTLLTSAEDIKHVNMLTRVKNYVMSNYAQKVTLDKVAETVYLSPTYLSKVFKKEVGMSFIKYLNNIRVEQSKYLLLFTDKPLSEIYTATGFEDQSYFTKVFKSITGVPPGKYREMRGKIKPPENINTSDI